MGKPLKIFWGLALVGVGIASGICGLKMIFGAAQYSATTTVFNINSIDDVPTRSNPRKVLPGFYFDPYFIQATFEIIRSSLVLSNVVVNLDLNGKWSKQRGNSSPLTTMESMATIQRNLRLAPVKHTKLIAITYISHDANEAALMANAIAEGYQNYRTESRSRYATSGLQVLQDQYQYEEQQISMLLTNVKQLRQQFGIQNNTATNQLPEQQPFWDEAHKLETLQKEHELLKAKIEEEKKDWVIPKTQMVQIIDRAEPPKSPIYLDRFLGAALLVLGFGLLAGGVRLLKPADN